MNKIYNKYPVTSILLLITTGLFLSNYVFIADLLYSSKYSNNL